MNRRSYVSIIICLNFGPYSYASFHRIMVFHVVTNSVLRSPIFTPNRALATILPKIFLVHISIAITILFISKPIGSHFHRHFWSIVRHVGRLSTMPCMTAILCSPSMSIMREVMLRVRLFLKPHTNTKPILFPNVFTTSSFKFIDALRLALQ